MKELILGNPILLLIGLFIGIISVVLAFHFSSQNVKFRSLLHRGFAILFFLGVPNLVISPFKELHFNMMLEPEQIRLMGIVQIFLYIIILFILSSQLKYSARKVVTISVELFQQNPFLWGLIFLSVLSACWSDTPGYTLRASMALVVMCLLATYFACHNNWKNLSQIIRWSFLLAAILSIFYATAVPSVGLDLIDNKGWRGIYVHPNKLAAYMCFTCGMWAIYATKKGPERPLAIISSLLPIYAMQQANSAGAKVIFLMLFCLIFWLRFIKSLKFRYALTAIILFSIVGVILFILVSENFEYIVVDTLGKDPTLTGRTPVWTTLITQAIPTKPLLGYGFYGFWQLWRGDENPAIFVRGAGPGYIWQVPHAHNGLLDLAVDLGIVGCILYILAYFRSVVHAVLYLGRSRQTEAIVPMVILFYILIKNISETGLWHITPDIFFFVLTSVRLSIENSKYLSRFPSN